MWSVAEKKEYITFISPPHNIFLAPFESPLPDGGQEKPDVSRRHIRSSYESFYFHLLISSLGSFTRSSTRPVAHQVNQPVNHRTLCLWKAAECLLDEGVRLFTCMPPFSVFRDLWLCYFKSAWELPINEAVLALSHKHGLTQLAARRSKTFCVQNVMVCENNTFTFFKNNNMLFIIFEACNLFS